MKWLTEFYASACATGLKSYRTRKHHKSIILGQPAFHLGNLHIA